MIEAMTEAMTGPLGAARRIVGMNQERIVELAADLDGNLAARIDFLLEIDKLKGVLRRSRLVDGSRYENTAEHSWHLAMAAMILAPHAGPGVDIIRAIEILLIHDLVEIDAGDIYIYDDAARADKERLEQAAAERIFGLLPVDQAERVAELWDEYERRETPTAVFAYAVDRLQPLLLNSGSGGVSWHEHGIRHSQATNVNSPIGSASSELWQLATKLLAEAADHGVLVDDRIPDAVRAP
jgi:putative hydrolase of HD superfamily